MRLPRTVYGSVVSMGLWNQPIITGGESLHATVTCLSMLVIDDYARAPVTGQSVMNVNYNIEHLANNINHSLTAFVGSILTCILSRSY